MTLLGGETCFPFMVLRLGLPDWGECPEMSLCPYPDDNGGQLKSQIAGLVESCSHIWKKNVCERECVSYYSWFLSE